MERENPGAIIFTIYIIGYVIFFTVLGTVVLIRVRYYKMSPYSSGARIDDANITSLMWPAMVIAFFIILTRWCIRQIIKGVKLLIAKF